ncbi:hypothetical protein C0992_011916 [Termitomyces sp. T32_za158]|nr:hypothetical protein C0992_011916 [Termitomyces sp. T32_za158]
MDNINDLEKLFKDYAVQENIDILHRVINEAKDRNAKGESSKDVWREDLEPRAAVSARTIPILESEVKRLREALTETQKMNNSLQSQIEENVAAAANGKQSANRLLDKLDQVHADWRNLLTEEVEAWTLQALESLKVGV